MKIDVLQHVAFEGLAAIQEWGEKKGVEFTTHRLDQKQSFPDAEEVNFLIILGGPMSSNDSQGWLEQERQLIEQVIALKRPILGICLGAQQIAKTLGARIYQDSYKEVGWHPIQSTSEVFDFVPKDMTVFHWHGEQFELPQGATRLFQSEACPKQGFMYNQHVIGLQFHFEATEESIESILINDSDYIDQGRYVQPASTIKKHPIPVENKHVLFNLLDYLSRYG
ncbi:type 1 glutamine amidotransferase [Gracilibacillus kekensis]|uniref:GMP synthase (Glutamine-hydrolysing) n=1 Tax=Gracilibacillus kekensis TaxID=1027249 RepID=A0A1M7Q1E7_9BACI|nr:type 1 glutamine amidotransferase [Gracilibacillus kekensis]SHN23997.1 GMP synthase (glutamine-hydrolysing) [Gracilibacillus kekensis]